MIYGLPYKGSKNAIAERIVAALPSGTNFCDCCCGGGAILQAAALSGKYKTVTGYDINKSIIGLIRATMIEFGSIDYEHFPVVSKEDFYAARDRNETLSDWLARYTASFGYNGMEYLWGDNRVKYKTLMHNAIALPTMEERRQAIRDFMTALVKDKLPEADLKNLCHLEQATNLNRFHEVEKIMSERKTKTKLDVQVASMFDIPFEKYDVIYFDPPYQDTKGYNGKSFSFIMFKALLTALVESGKTVFVSEYNAPAAGFTEVAAFPKQMLQDAYKNTPVTEKLFYGGSIEQYKDLPSIQPQSSDGSDTALHLDSDGGTEQALQLGVDFTEGSFQCEVIHPETGDGDSGSESTAQTDG